MYNGIGLTTARGSGTNAYVQKNLSFTNKVKQRVEYKTEEDIKKLDASVNRPANQAILAHQRKRQIELKCLEMREKMEDQGYTETEIEEKVASYREVLRLKAEEVAKQKDLLFKFDENGRPNVKETHQMAEINEERNNKLKNALRISPYFVEGSSLDCDRKAKESNSKNEQQQKYEILENTPSPELPKQMASKVNVVEKKDDKIGEKSEGSRTKSGEKNKEKRNQLDDEKPKKEIPKKYAHDDRKHKRSRTRSKSRSRSDKYSKDYKKSGSKKAHYYNRSKRSRRDSESSRSSRERERRSHSSRSSSYSESSDSSSSSSSTSSSQSSHNSSSSYSSRGKSTTRSPPIRRRRGSPNFLEKRRITSARKRPVPYHRRSPSCVSDSLCSASSDDSCFSSLSTVSRNRCDWRRSSHTSTTNSLIELT